MTIALEQILEGDWASVERMRQTLQSLVLDPGGQTAGIRFGADTITWPGGAVTSNGKSVSHGLGRTPKSVVAAGSTSSGLNTFPTISVQTLTATTFTVFAGTVDAQTPLNTATTAFFWVAIG